MAQAEPKSLFKTQYEFTAHIRDPEHAPRPADVEDRRMAIYRDLFYNNIQGFIRDGFPVLRKLSDDSVWHARVRDFFSHYRCKSPYFVDISKEFVEFLGSQRVDHPDDPPYILELAHYEWVELDVRIAHDTLDRTRVDPNGDLLNGAPVISQVARPLYYQYPVHRITPDFQPGGLPDKPTFLVVYRDRKDRVQFLEINAVTYRLLELLTQFSDESDQERLTGRQALAQIAGELNHATPDKVIESGAGILNDLRSREIIVGTAR